MVHGMVAHAATFGPLTRYPRRQGGSPACAPHKGSTSTTTAARQAPQPLQHQHHIQAPPRKHHNICRASTTIGSTKAQHQLQQVSSPVHIGYRVAPPQQNQPRWCAMGFVATRRGSAFCASVSAHCTCTSKHTCGPSCAPQVEPLVHMTYPCRSSLWERMPGKKEGICGTDSHLHVAGGPACLPAWWPASASAPHVGGPRFNTHRAGDPPPWPSPT